MTRSKKILSELSFLRELVHQAPGFVLVLLGRDYRFFLANHAFMKLVGNRPIHELKLVEAIPELKTQGLMEELDIVWQTGEPRKGHHHPIFLSGPERPKPELCYVDFIHQPLRDENGEMIGIYVQGVDVTDQVNFEKQLKIVAEESTHRVKNIITMVAAVVMQSLRRTKDFAEAKTIIAQRLTAIATAQDTLVSRLQNTSELGKFMTETLAVAQETFKQIKLAGPKVDLPEKARLPLALTLHELTTNALKYGALTTERGKIEIFWSKANGNIINISWRELNGPEITKPIKKGFGTLLIERSLAYQIENYVQIDFKKEGLVCEMAIAA